MVTFKVSYEGEALQRGEMNVRELAPALLALDDMLSNANHQIYPNAGGISLSFRSIEKGSFIVELSATYNGIINLFTSKDMTALANILSLLGLTGAGLWQMIKQGKGRRLKKLTDTNNDTIKIDFGDGDELEVKKEVTALYANPLIRQAVYDVLRPLETKGVDGFRVFGCDGDNETLSISKEETTFFIPPTIDDEELPDSEIEISLSIVSLAFKDDNKWRLSDGSNTYNVRILDKEFLNSIEKNIATFSKGDVLKVIMRTRQWRTASGLKTEHEIINILDHFKGPKQIDLPFEKDN